MRFKISILLLTGLTAGTASADNRVFEKAAAVYRPLNQTGISGFGHAGIYFNSKSNYSASKAEFQARDLKNILDSNGEHRIIHSPGGGRPVEHVPFAAFLGNQAAKYQGAHEPVGGVTAPQRHDIVLAAGTRLDSPYEFYSGWKGPVGFRCDGLVSVAYAQAGVPIPEHDGGKWRKNSPRSQRHVCLQRFVEFPASELVCGFRRPRHIVRITPSHRL